MRFAPLRWIEANGLPRPRVLLGILALCGRDSAVIVPATTCSPGRCFFSRSGAIFLEARMMEDGLIKPVLDTDCPKAGYAICAYKDQLPARADAWLWVDGASPFHKARRLRQARAGIGRARAPKA